MKSIIALFTSLFSVVALAGAATSTPTTQSQVPKTVRPLTEATGPVRCYSAPDCQGLIGTMGNADVCKMAWGKSYAPIQGGACHDF